jgi:hypothetical protein
LGAVFNLQRWSDCAENVIAGLRVVILERRGVCWGVLTEHGLEVQRSIVGGGLHFPISFGCLNTRRSHLFLGVMLRLGSVLDEVSFR